MTALVGILNVRGAAIAADSAVTMVYDRNKKISNSANKMLRLSSAQPVSVMTCGIGSFLGTPWDIIIRRYRQKRGQASLPTVQAYVDDFFSYMVSEKIFFPDTNEKKFLQYSLNTFFQVIKKDIPLIDLNDNGVKINVKFIIEAFRAKIKDRIAAMSQQEKCHMLEDYTLEQFTKKVSPIVDKFINEQTSDECVSKYPLEVFQAIRDNLTEGLWRYVTTRPEKAGTKLVFTGFGANEDYPTLISADVNGGFDGRVRYHIKDDNIVHVSADKPVAICPFAQVDIMNSLLTGLNPGFNDVACKKSLKMFMEFGWRLSEKVCGEETDAVFSDIFQKVKSSDLHRSFIRYDHKLMDISHKQWLKKLRNYDLQDLAQLAENLIAMTNLERLMTFREEGVGGPIDLAIISKNNGFTWLNRKSWYHHVDVGGRYGKFGV